MNIFHIIIIEQSSIKNIKVFIFFIFSSYYVLTSTLNAEVYKWVDENGKVHFSDKKLKSSAEKIEVKNNKPSIQPSQQQNTSNQAIKKQKYLDFLKSEREEKKEKKQKKQRQLAKQKRRCTTLKDQLKSYEENRALWYELDEETGERQYLSEEALQKEIANLRAEIKSGC